MADWLESNESAEENTTPPALPYSDNLMTWSQEKRRYILKEEAFEAYTGMNVRSMVNDSLGAVPNIVAYYFDNVSLKVYNYIYANRTDFERRYWALTYSPTAREMLYRCMVEQMVYFITNGDISKFSGINLKTGAVIDRRHIRAATISPDVIEILRNTPIPELGNITILYAGVC
ncbi:MAG: hypothetical protein IJY04_01275 [Clostridia bacterium]|nr:hypothetical protein [Clostridia bacterium]